jgi:hypothetical protein
MQLSFVACNSFAELMPLDYLHRGISGKPAVTLAMPPGGKSFA